MSYYPYAYSSGRNSPYPPSRHGQHLHVGSIRDRDWPPPQERRRRITPAKHSWLDGFSRLGPSDRDLATLKDGQHPMPKDLGLKEGEAAKLAVDALTNYERTRMEALSDENAHEKYPRDALPFQIFHELDQEMFRGVLKENVHLRWSDLELGVHGATSRAGGNGYARITIELNSKFRGPPTDHRFPREGLVAALIHHMTHAYFLVCCGFRNEDVTSNKYDLSHDSGFCSLLHQIQSSLKLRSCRKLPSLFTCTSLSPGPRQTRIDSHKRSAAGTSQCFFSLDETLPSSVCHEYLRNISTVAKKQGSDQGSESKPRSNNPYPIDSHVLMIDYETLVPKPHRRSEYNVHHAEYVELHFHGQAYPVSRAKIILHPSLRAKLQQIQGSPGSAQCIPIPASSFEEFLSLVLFVEKGDYPPDKPEQLSQLRHPGIKGPPKIMDFKRDCKPYLVTDIRAYSIAKKIGFEELKKRALERLYTQAFTHNDPMEALEEIYGRLEKEARDGDLRSWVKKWLVAEHSIGSTNFEYLSNDPQWKDKFAGLRRKGGDFLEDVDSIMDELMRQRGYVSSVGSFFSAGSIFGITSGSYGGSMAPCYAPTPMPSPKFHANVPMQNCADHRDHRAVWPPPSRSQTPPNGCSQNSWGPGPGSWMR